MKIVKRTQFPEPRHRWPFPDMKVGECLILQGKEVRYSMSARSSACTYGKKAGKKFAGKKVSDNEYHIWREA